MLAEGDTSGAIALLGREAAAAAGAAATASRKSVELYRRQAALLRLQNLQDALKALELALLAEPEDFNTLWVAEDLALAVGNSADAQRNYNKMAEVAARALAADAANTERQHDLSVSYDKIGDVQAAQGDSAAALKSYQTGLTITERLAAAAPRNTQWQRDLSISYDKIGDVQVEQGDSTAALKSYQAGLAITERLAAAAARDTQWQRD